MIDNNELIDSVYICEYCKQEAEIDDHDLVCSNQEWDYLKFIGEGANSITELVAMLKSTIEQYEAKEEEGWYLSQPIIDGHIFMVRQN
jgi:hypothetical protein